MEDGPPLVVACSVWGELNMSASYAELWRPYRELGHRVVVYDGRGMGASDHSTAEYTIDARLKDFEAVVDHLELNEFPVYGHSPGVALAIAYAAKHPERVTKLVLVNGAASGREWYKSSVPAMRVASGLTHMFEDEWESATMAIAGAVTDYRNANTVNTLAAAFRDGMSTREYLLFQKQYSETDVTQLLPQLQTKTLLAYISDYVKGTLPFLREMASAMPNASLVETSIKEAAGVIREFLGVDTEQADRDEGPVPGGFATILFTDMESSTALTQRLGDAAAQEVRRTHNEIVRTALGIHAGREIKHTGDGIMASFATASSALDCAIAIQQDVATHKEEHPGSPLGVYIGLNAGEPIAEDDDLFGTSVDLAARLVDHAQPGQIIASDVVRQLAAGKDFFFADLGETELRGFEDPIKLWELRWQENG